MHERAGDTTTDAALAMLETFASIGATAFAVGISLERPSTVTFVSGAVYVGAMIVLALVWMLPWAVCLVVRKTAWRA